MSTKKQSRDPHFQWNSLSNAVCFFEHIGFKARVLDKQHHFIVWILSSHKFDFRSNSVDSLQDICLNILCWWKAFPHDILGSKPFLQTL